MMPGSTITGLEVQKRNKERVNVYLDGEYAFSLDIMQAAALRQGQILTESEITALRESGAVSRAVEMAVRFLSYRPRSTAEVRRNLAEKDVADPVIEQAVERLSGLGYLDDAAFARFWVENRSTFKPLSPRALRYELRQKGVADTVIDDVLADVDAFGVAYRAATSRVSRLRGSDHETFRQRLYNFLQRRGFSFDTIRDVVEQLIDELETEDTEYFTNPN